MILTDREIRLALRAGRIIIRPEPDAAFFSATSVDLTLHHIVRRWIGRMAGVDVKLAPGRPGYNFAQIHQRLTEPVQADDEGCTRT